MYTNNNIENFWWHDLHLVDVKKNGNDCIWRFNHFNVKKENQNVLSGFDMRTEVGEIHFVNYRFGSIFGKDFSDRTRQLIFGDTHSSYESNLKESPRLSGADQIAPNLVEFEFIESYGCPRIEIIYDRLEISWSKFAGPTFDEQQKIDLLKKISELSNFNSKEVQIKAINSLKNIPYPFMDLLVMPSQRSCWENAAIVLSEKDYAAIKQVIPGMMEWIKDKDWPGANTIFKLLKTIPRYILLNHLMIAIDNAIDSYSLSSASWLCVLYTLLDECDLNDAVKTRLANQPKERMVILIKTLAREKLHLEDIGFMFMGKLIGSLKLDEEIKRCVDWLLGIAEQAGITQADFE